MTVGHELARSLVAGFDEDGLAVAGFALADAVGSRQGGEMDETCMPGVPRGNLARAAADFERRGWLRSRDVGWSVPMGAMPHDVPAFLQGVAPTRAAFARTETSHAVITMPRAPSALANALPATGMAYAFLLSTADGMARVAMAARKRFVVIMPFLNLDGLRFTANLFAMTSAQDRKLVLRRNSNTLRVLAEGGNWLLASMFSFLTTTYLATAAMRPVTLKLCWQMNITPTSEVQIC